MNISIISPNIKIKKPSHGDLKRVMNSLNFTVEQAEAEMMSNRTVTALLQSNVTEWSVNLYGNYSVHFSEPCRPSTSSFDHVLSHYSSKVIFSNWSTHSQQFNPVLREAFIRMLYEEQKQNIPESYENKFVQISINGTEFVIPLVMDEDVRGRRLLSIPI